VIGGDVGSAIMDFAKDYGLIGGWVFGKVGVRGCAGWFED